MTDKIHVLVVDDEPELLDVIRIDLEAAGFGVTCAGTVAAARASLASGAFDVILSDVLMPGGGGFGLVDALPRRLDRPLPLVLMTGFVDPDGTLKARAMGVEMLGKPVNPVHLRETLRRVAQL